MSALRSALLAGCLAVPVLANAHGGGLDTYGCHHNRKAGGYHCHRGPLAGQDFASKDEMLSAHEAGTSKTATAGQLAERVVAIQDGDTLTVLVSREQINVRLLDIDAPERRQPFGARSRQSLAELCATREATVLEGGKDRYGRTLGRVICAGVHANAEQVHRGMAWVYERYAPRDSPLYALQTEARAPQSGVYGQMCTLQHLGIGAPAIGGANDENHVSHTFGPYCGLHIP